MDTQAYVNILLGIISVLGSIMLTFFGFTMRQILSDIKGMSKAISDLNVLIAGDYVKRSEYDRVISEIFKKLDRLMERQNDTK